MRSRFLMLAVAAIFLSGSLHATGAELLRDPTRPYFARPDAPAKGTTFDVTAILVADERRVAIVNGQRVTEGDQVDGATVIEILTDELRLEYHGKEITTKLPPDALRNL